MSIIAGTAIESALGGYQIERSLRFNSADFAYLNRTLTTPTNNLKWTFSCWFKRSAFGSENGYTFINAGGAAGGAAGEDYLSFIASTGSGMDGIVFAQSNASTTYLLTTPKYRDPSAWYHLVFIYDSANATSSNRALLYINGVQVTAFSSSTYPTSSLASKINSAVLHRIGCRTYAVDGLFDGYMTEINFIDGSALDPTSFGEYNTNTGVWQPIAYTGSYGTNGFYLNFSDNSNNTATTLGKDYSGNGNNWTPNNFVVTTGVNNDSLVDTPTPYGTDTGVGGEVRGNYCTLNPLDEPSTYASFGSSANGNLDFSVSNDAAMGSTISVSSGKWYWEMTVVSGHSSGANTVWTAITSITPSSSNKLAWQAGSGSRSYATTGLKYSENTSASYGNTYTNGDVIGCALDLDNGKVYWSKNGTFQASGDPVAGTNAAYTGLTGSWMPEVTQNGAVTAWNFGQRPFAYTAPSGFKALCTQNLPEPTVVDGSQYFDVDLWTGNGTGQSITTPFAPDFVWIKARNQTYDNQVWDILRGPLIKLATNQSDAESSLANSVTSFNSNGYTLGDTATVNLNNDPFVGWAWKANGSGVSIAAGSIDGTNPTIASTVSANPTAGFSIVTYTGINANATVAHGLSPSGFTNVPQMVITKRRSPSGYDWNMYHVGLTSAAYTIYLNLTDSQINEPTAWNSTAPVSQYFSIGTRSGTGSAGNFVAYCFAPIPGYSAFGNYTGNLSSNGPFVYTGFRPRYVLLKRYDTGSTGSWYVWDTARDTYNWAYKWLAPNSAVAENTSSGSNVWDIDILSNGFKIRNDGAFDNASGGTYIYAAFAENPFKYALAR